MREVKKNLTQFSSMVDWTMEGVRILKAAQIIKRLNVHSKLSLTVLKQGEHGTMINSNLLNQKLELKFRDACRE